MPETEQATGSKAPLGWLLLIVVMASLLYVLSIGPAVAFVSQKYSPSMGDAVLRKLYASVHWLHEHTILERPITAWVELWI
jgi:hypothetical protein